MAAFDPGTTEPEWALAYRFDIVLRETPFERMRTPSQTVGPYFTLGLCNRPQSTLPNGTVEVHGAVYDGQGTPVADALVEVWDPDIGFGRSGTDAAGEFRFLVPAGVRRLEVMVFARGLLKPVLTRMYAPGEDARRGPDDGGGAERELAALRRALARGAGDGLL